MNDKCAKARAASIVNKAVKGTSEQDNIEVGRAGDGWDDTLLKKPREWFEGRVVQLRFPVIGSADITGERMWVTVLGIGEGGFLLGRLDNTPVYSSKFQNGDGVKFRVEDIIKVAP